MLLKFKLIHNPLVQPLPETLTFPANSHMLLAQQQLQSLPAMKDITAVCFKPFELDDHFKELDIWLHDVRVTREHIAILIITEHNKIVEYQHHD